MQTIWHSKLIAVLWCCMGTSVMYGPDRNAEPVISNLRIEQRLQPITTITGQMCSAIYINPVVPYPGYSITALIKERHASGDQVGYCGPLDYVRQLQVDHGLLFIEGKIQDNHPATV